MLLISEMLVAELEREAPPSRMILEAVPEEHLDWRPHAKSMTLGRLAGHIAELPAWAGSMVHRDFDVAAKGAYEPFAATNRATLLDAFDRGLATFSSEVGGQDDGVMKAMWTMRYGDKVLFSAPRHEAIRTLAINHAIHHRGQLSVYLRLLDVPVPSVYGPTADTPDFMGE